MHISQHRLQTKGLVIRDLMQLTRQRQVRRRLKLNFSFQLEFRKWLHVLTVSYGATPQLQHNVYKQRRAPNGNFKKNAAAVW